MEVFTPCPPSGLGDMIWMRLSGKILTKPFSSIGCVPGAVCALAFEKKEKLIKSPPPLRAEDFRKALRFREDEFFMV
jgi:hypothetical protein